MFAHFLELQDRILNLASRAEAILGSDTHDVVSLGQTRWEVVRALREYHLFNQSRIFDPIERAGDGRAAKARTMKADCVRSDEEYREYILKWSAVSISDHWAEYHPAALGSITRIRAQLARERVDVADLLQMRSAS